MGIKEIEEGIKDPTCEECGDTTNLNYLEGSDEYVCSPCIESEEEQYEETK